MADEPPMEPLPPAAAGGPIEYASLTAQPRSGMAIGAMICGILSVPLGIGCFFVGLPLATVALVLGIIAFRRSTRDRRRHGGKGMAVVAICTGAVGILVGPALLGFSMRAMVLAERTLATQMWNATNLNMIYMGLAEYEHAHGTLPPDLQTLTTTGQPLATYVASSSSGDSVRVGDYFYVNGVSTGAPGDWILAWLQPVPRSDAGVHVLYADGRVEHLQEPQFTRELEKFKREYTRVRGSPPDIVPPR